MAISLDPVRPYLGLIKAGLVAALLAGVFVKGCSYGVEREAGAHAKAIAGKDQVIARKDRALSGAAESLRGAARVLREVDAEAQRLLDAEKAAKKREADAAKVAARAQADLARRIDGFAKALEHARKNPDCAALLSADLRKTCGI